MPKAVLLPFSIRDNISYVKLCVLQLYSAMFHDDAIPPGQTNKIASWLYAA